MTVDVDGDHYNEQGRNILDYASDSSSDDEMVNVTNILDGHDMDNSDNDSVDSQNDDILKYVTKNRRQIQIFLKKNLIIFLQTCLHLYNRGSHNGYKRKINKITSFVYRTVSMVTALLKTAKKKIFNENKT